MLIDSFVVPFFLFSYFPRLVLSSSSLTTDMLHKLDHFESYKYKRTTNKSAKLGISTRRRATIDVAFITPQEIVYDALSIEMLCQATIDADLKSHNCTADLGTARAGGKNEWKMERI